MCVLDFKAKIVFAWNFFFIWCKRRGGLHEPHFLQHSHYDKYAIIQGKCESLGLYEDIWLLGIYIILIWNIGLSANGS